MNIALHFILVIGGMEINSPTDEEERWSDDFDSDYENPDEHSDSEMYVMPAEETGDDSYEPPPVEQQTRVVHPALPFTRGEYVDNRSSQRHSPPFSKSLPSKPSWPPTKTRLTSTLPSPTSLQKPQIPPKPKDLLEDEADYVVPVEDNDENYIHPRESSPLPTEKGRNSGVWDSKSSLPAAPSPLPRAGKKTATPLKTKSLSLLNATEGLVTDKTPHSHQCFLPPRSLSIKSLFLCQGFQKREAQLQMDHYLAFHRIPLLQTRYGMIMMSSDCFKLTLGKGSSSEKMLWRKAQDGEAELHGKPWYAGACDRKSAEEALHRSNKDGSFLIRKSSGHDSKQPYTLVAFFNKRVYNIPVRFIEATKQYALGKKKNGEEYFGSVVDIVKNHQHNPLVLIDSQNNTKDSTRLKYAVKVS
ncbi:hypothetical protein U0070_024058 [Myodes glareolus]|uniref:SH2 domain-containing protein n=1 Tax=Myodes glareolus TaxID=447135 RepID=A0AAW0HUD2_MYOGA